jgi:hypothetical protein
VCAHRVPHSRTSPPSIDDEVVVKPNISAGARDTGRFASTTAAADLIAKIHASGRIALVQPYLRAVDDHGETSVVFIGGVLSHVLTKRAILREEGVAPVTEGRLPVATAMLENDLVAPGTPDDAEKSPAVSVHSQIAARFGVPTYARIDIVLDAKGQPLLSELELIEPSLYLRLASGASERLAIALNAS